MQLCLTARLGSYIDPNRPLLFASPALSEAGEAAAQTAFHFESERSFDEDDRFCLIVLSEIASRALSPSTNDPGTAIDVLSLGTRVLARWRARSREKVAEVQYPRLHVPEVDIDDALGDAFRWISRDGAGQLEVASREPRAASRRASPRSARSIGTPRRPDEAAEQRGASVLPRRHGARRRRRTPGRNSKPCRPRPCCARGVVGRELNGSLSLALAPDR